MLQQFLRIIVLLILVGLLISACKPATTVVLSPAVESSPNTIPMESTTLTLVPSMAPLPTVMSTISPTVAPTMTLLPAPEPAWTYDVGTAIWSSPTISENVIYFGSDNGNLYAIDLQTRQLRWKFPTGGQVRSRPAISDGTVYFTSDDSYLYALRSDSGEERWHADLGAGKMPDRGNLTSTWDYQQSSPVVAEGKVYVGSGNQGLFAFDAESGDLLWEFATVGRVRNTPSIADGLVFIGDQLALLHAVDADTGIEKWQSQGCDIPTPLVYNGLVYCGSRLLKDLRAWEAKTGELRWKFSFQGSWVESSPRVANDTLYIGSSDVTALYAIDPYVGNLKWKFLTGGYPWSTPVIENGVVYIGSYLPGKDVNDIYAVDAGTSQLLWSMPVPIGVVSSPQVVDGVVYFGGLDGKLYAVQTIH